MDKKLLKQLTSEVGSCNMQVPLKINEFLDKLISCNLNRDGINITKAEFIREVLYIHFMPELLQARLYSKTANLFNQDALSTTGLITFNLKERKEQLHQIIKMAEIAVDETEKFEQKIINANAEYLEQIKKKLDFRHNR